MSSKSKIDSFKEFVLEQLRGLPAVECRRMFGAYGLYSDDQFFGIVAAGRLYFKTNNQTRQSYIDYGSKPFKPTPKQTLKNYYEVPVEIVEDRQALGDWAQSALGVA